MAALTTRPATTATRRLARFWGPIYAWSGLAIMWTFWASFVVFLADPPWAREWGLPTVDGGGIAPALQHPVLAALADLALIAVFGLQHSVMARPWFKAAVLSRVPQAFERCTFVHAANMALIALILLWQPIPIELWHASPPMRAVLWIAFAVGWVILFLGALSFGIFDLLGIAQMRACTAADPFRTLCIGQPPGGFREPWPPRFCSISASSPSAGTSTPKVSSRLELFCALGILAVRTAGVGVTAVGTHHSVHHRLESAAGAWYQCTGEMIMMPCAATHVG